MIAVCPTHQKLKSLSLGQLPEKQSDELLRHLENCESCQIEIGQIDEAEDPIVGKLKSAGGELPDKFETENGCRIAMTRALAALAAVEVGAAGGGLPELPKSIGEYDIVKLLGRGGMGHVYLGEHTKLNRLVAIKFIADHRRWDKTMHERFESEMRLIGGLKHPNIVAAHDAREVDGLAVLVTEYIDGMTISEILGRTGKLGVADACKVVSEVCKALEHIGSKGLVHRDIKPSNIMIDVDGKVKLLDLGLARLQAGDEEAGEFTATGQAMGTADYVAPEQINDTRNVDVRADVYGLGCTFYKLLSGRAPYAGKHLTAFAKMNAHVSEVAESLGSLDTSNDIPGKLVSLVEQMLEKDPKLRPQSPNEILVCVDQFAGSSDLADLVARSKLLPILAQNSHALSVKKPKTESSFLGKYPWMAAIAGGLAAFLFGLWLGITITVKKADGTSTTVQIPDGSTAIVDADGNIEVRLAGSDQKIHVPRTSVIVAPGNTAISDSVSRDDQPDYGPANVGDDSEFEDMFGGPTTETRARIHLSPESPLYDKVETGDLIDIFSVAQQPSADGLESAPRLIASKMLVSRTQGRNEGTRVIFFDIPADQTELYKTYNQWKNYASGEPSPPQLQFEFHDPDHQVVEDNIRLNGVWRVVLTQVMGKVVDPGVQTFLFHRNQLIQTNDERFSQHDYVLKNKSNQNVIQIGLIDSYYRFLENGRLEIYGSSMELPVTDMGSQTFSHVIRLEKVDTPNTKQEKIAFEIIALSNQAESEFACYLVEEFDQHDFEAQKLDPSARVITNPQTGIQTRLVGTPVISNKDILSTKVTESSGRFDLGIQLTYEAGQRLGKVTALNLDKPMAILVDDKLIATPVIQSAIYRSLSVSGGFTKQEASQLASSIVPKIRFPQGFVGTNLAARAQSQANLKRIMLALHNYENAFRHFPTYSLSDRGKHPYSWRVAILEFLGKAEAKLYKQYNFDEPWDSKANAKVLNQMPDVFRHPSFSKDSTSTNYVGIVGNDAGFGIDKGRKFGEIWDGSSNTIFLIESKADIPWTKPEDFKLDSLKKKGPELHRALTKFLYLDKEGLGVGFGDAYADFLDRAVLTPELTAEYQPGFEPATSTLFNLFKINDGISIDRDNLRYEPSAPSLIKKN